MGVVFRGTNIGDFLWRCKKIPTLFYAEAGGRYVFLGVGVYFFGVFGTKKWAKNGGSSTVLDQKKCFFWWVKWAKTYHARAFLYRFGVSFSSDKRVFGGEKATFLATTKTEKRGDATFFRGGSCREGLAKIRGDVRVGRGFLCRGRPFLRVEKSVAL